MKPTLEYLQDLEANKHKEKERVKLAIKHKICPVCGAPIIQQDWEDYDKPTRFLFWKIKGHMWDYRAVCSDNKSHYEYCWDTESINCY
jgi:hypothetical protein